MRLGGKMDNRIDLLLGKNPLDQSSVTDISLDEAVTGIILDPVQIFRIARVSQFVEVHQPGADIPSLEHQMHEIRADKAATAGN